MGRLTGLKGKAHLFPAGEQPGQSRVLSCAFFDEARRSAGIMIFAYVIMPDHIHLITDGSRKIKEVLRFVNGVSAKRVLDHLKSNGHEGSLTKLRIQERKQRHKYSLCQHHANAFGIYGEETMMQKVNYVHLNPVRAGLAERPEEYRFSSTRLWRGRPWDDEPLVTDHNRIAWRSAA